MLSSLAATTGSFALNEESLPPKPTKQHVAKNPVSITEDKEELMRLIRLNVVDERDLKESDWSDPEILSATLSSYSLRAHAFDRMSITDLDHPKVVNALAGSVVNAAPDYPENLREKLFSHGALLLALAARVPESSPEHWRVLQVLVQEPRADEDLYQRAREQLLPVMLNRLEELLKEAAHLPPDEVEERVSAILTPSRDLLKTQPGEALLARYIPLLPEGARVSTLQWCKFWLEMDLDPSVASASSDQEQIKFGGHTFGKSNYRLRSNEEILNLFTETGSAAFEHIWHQHLYNEEIATEVERIITDDIRSITILTDGRRRLSTVRDNEVLKKIFEKALQDERNQDRIIEQIEADLFSLGAYPSQASRIPSISHAARTALNEMLMIGYRPPEKQSDIRVNSLVTNHSTNIPDFYALVSPASYHGLSTFVLNNPRFYSDWISVQERPPEGLNKAWQTVNEVSDLLGIRSFRRFDNFRAIVRNRYLVERADVQQKLVDLLGEKYFEGVFEDNRPICLVAYAHPRTDHNNAFQVEERFLAQNDMIDYLTSYYRVIYCEPEWDYDPIELALRMGRVLGVGIPEGIFAGHGSTPSLKFSFQRLADGISTNGSWEVEDYELFKELDPVITPDGRLIFFSCSTGKVDPELGTGLGKTLAKALPGRTVYAPSGDAGVYLNFNRDGSIKDVAYPGASVVRYLPDGTREVDSYRLPLSIHVYHGVRRFRDLFRDHPWTIVPTSFAAIFLLGGLWGMGRNLYQRLRPRKEEKEDPIFEPSDTT